MGGLKSGQLRTGLLQDGLKTGKLRSGLRNVSTWAPSQIDSLAHWYDATEISGSDGDAIGTWTDQEGTDDLTQATSSKKPTLRTSGINSKNILEFDGSDDLLNVDIPNISNPFEVFVVLNFRTPNSGVQEIVVEGTDGNSNPVPLYKHSDDSWRTYGGSDFVDDGAADSNDHLLDTIQNGGSGEVILDGTSQATATGIGSDAMLEITVGSGLWLTNPASVDIGELLVYSTELSTSDRSDVENYVSDKWNITI